MKSEHQKRVEEFMRLANQELPNRPTLPSKEVRQLRAKLIMEEALETIEALGFIVYTDQENINVTDTKLLFEGLCEPNLVEIIDGCCDLKVVTTGTLTACGLPDEIFQEEVDRNNLDKFGPGHSRREDGKLIKPPNHKPPRIQEILNSL